MLTSQEDLIDLLKSGDVPDEFGMSVTVSNTDPDELPKTSEFIITVIVGFKGHTETEDRIKMKLFRLLHHTPDNETPSEDLPSVILDGLGVSTGQLLIHLSVVNAKTNIPVMHTFGRFEKIKHAQTNEDVVDFGTSKWFYFNGVVEFTITPSVIEALRTECGKMLTSICTYVCKTYYQVPFVLSKDDPYATVEEVMEEYLHKVGQEVQEDGLCRHVFFIINDNVSADKEEALDTEFMLGNYYFVTGMMKGNQFGTDPDSLRKGHASATHLIDVVNRIPEIKRVPDTNVVIVKCILPKDKSQGEYLTSNVCFYVKRSGV